MVLFKVLLSNVISLATAYVKAVFKMLDALMKYKWCFGLCIVPLFDYLFINDFLIDKVG